MNRMLGWFFATMLVVSLAGCGAGDRNVRPSASSPNVSSPSAPTSGDIQKAAKINTQLGLVYLQEGRMDLALTQLRKALQQDPDLAEAHDAIAVLYEQLGEVRLAEQHYRRALDISPDDSRAQNNYGQLLCRAGRYQDAERHFLAAAKNPLYKRAAMAYTNAALCLPKSASSHKREAYLRAALARNPLYPPALLEMARIKHNQGDNEAALKLLERYRSVASFNPQMLLLGVKVARALGDTVAEMHYASLLRTHYPQSQQSAELQKLTDQ